MPMMTETPEYVSYPQAIQLYHVSRAMLVRWVRQGKIREYQRAAGGYPMLRSEEVAAAVRIVPVEREGE